MSKIKIKKKINKYPNGGRQYEWSKGIDNIQPITLTQTQNNSSITIGNKKLSTEELKKAAEYTKKYNQQHLEEEYNNRQNKLKQSIDAQKQPLSLKNLQTQTQSTGDKFSLAMNSKYGNPKDYPTLSGYMQGLDYINPAKMIGDMTSGLGSVPQDIKEGNYLKAGLSVASPLAVGAMAGVGANSVKPFVNNLVNPLAGTGEVINNLGNKYLPNAYKLNPSAFKPNSEAYYRIIGNEEGLDDLVNSGVLRSNPNNLNKKGSLMYKDPYFSKGVIFDKDYYKNNPYKGKYVAEVSDIEMHHNPPGSFSFDNNIAIPKDPIKINNPNLKLYQKDWLKGYKPIEIPKKGFNSEINWGKWNKEIPENQALMREYNAIEQTSKANGSWMKNPDGSKFQGTPEQFVQQNSANFKNAFPNGFEKGFRGDMTGDVHLTGNVGNNRTIFLADKETGKHYAGSKGNLFELYHPKSENSISFNNQGRSWRNISRNHFGENPPNLDVLSGRLNTPQIGNYTSTDDIAEWIQKNNKDYVNIDNIFDGADADFVKMVNHKKGNYLKSAIGNNGMFDMTNPNIYKTLVPGVIGLGAASQIDKKQNGGNITTESEWELVNEDLPKAGNGLSLVKTLTPIGNKVIPRNPSLYKDAINNVDKIEHNINDRYRVQADDFTDKNYPTDYDEDSGHNDYVDALRHSATAMYTTSGQGNFLAPLKVPYTNVMGLAHELKGLGSYVSNPDKLTWQGAKQQLRETGSDLYNNFVGSMIGGLPINIENKEKILKFAKDKNILSDLSKKQNGGKLPKRRLNLNKSSDWEIVD